MSLRTPLSLVLLVSLSLSGLAACKGEGDAAPATPSPTERVRNIDLPLSRRNADTLNSDAVDVLIAFDAIAIDGHDVATLNRGGLTPAPTRPEPIAALAAAIPAGKQAAHLRMHQAVRYATLLSVIATLNEKGIHRVGFDVRRDSLASATGVFVFDHVDVRPPSREPQHFDPPYGREWDAMTELWDDAFVACSASPGSFDCSPVPQAAQIAFGGEAEIALFRRQNGIILDFRRFGMGNDLPAQAGFLEQQNSRNARERDRDADRAANPPASLASFGFRWESLSAEPNAPIATIMRELTRNGPVGVRVSADASSEAGAVVSLVGASFPEGVPAPALMLDAQAR